MIDKLINSGYTFLNFDPTKKNIFKTYVVLGLGRSGTSMIAGSLHTLGINMGERLGHTYEDPMLSKICEKKDFELAKRMIIQKNSEYLQWGWKRPSSVNYIEQMEDMFEDVIFLVVWRDIFAIANRNKISMEYDLIESMKHSIKSYEKLLSFVKKTKKPTVLISYEKAMLKREEFVDLLYTLVGTSNSKQKQDTLLFITDDPKEYLKSSRVTNANGVVGKMGHNVISGWAFFPKVPDKIAIVTLSVNGEIVANAEANEQRKHLRENGTHESGRCGFSFHNLAELNIKIGDEIILMVDNDIKELKNGKYIVKKDFFNE